MTTQPTFTAGALAKLDPESETEPNGRPVADSLTALAQGLETRLDETPWFERLVWTERYTTPYVGPSTPDDSSYVWLGLVDERYRSLSRASHALQFEFGVDGGSATGFLDREVLWGVLLGPWADDDVVDEVAASLRDHADSVARFLCAHEKYVLVTTDATLDTPTSAAVETAAEHIGEGLAVTHDLSMAALPELDPLDAACETLETLAPLYRLLAGVEGVGPEDLVSPDEQVDHDAAVLRVEELAAATKLTADDLADTVERLQREGSTREEALGYVRRYLADMLDGSGLFAVRGVGPSTGKRLVEAGVETVDDLLAVDPQEVAGASDLSAEQVGRFQDAAAEEAFSSFDPADRRAADRVRDVDTTSRTDRGATPPSADGDDPSPLTERSGPSESTDPATGGETADSDPTVPESGADGFPPELVERDQWLLWKPTDDGRKIPRAPWSTGDPLRFVSAMDPDHWTSFATALEWAEKLPQDLRPAFCLTRGDGIAFVDLDDVVVDGALTDAAARIVDEADSYAAVSTSGTGVHVFVRGSLAEGVKAVTGPLGDDGADGSVEVYDRNRFVAVTGDRIEGTPESVRSADSVLRQLEDEHATVASATPDRATAEPARSRRELRELEATGDIQDVFDAIRQTRPADIRLRSTQTREHGDGTASYDPSWVHSESGTRLGVLEDVWIYRKGMIALDALQVVALEEGIITDERAYPEGETFWEAVEALRERGAAIPTYEPSGVAIDDDTGAGAADDTADESVDESTVTTALNYGEPVRDYVHPHDRDYQERLALELAPTVVAAVEELRLPPAVASRAAEVYAAAHAAAIVPGASHETTVAAAVRLASILEDHPRPLDAVATALDVSPGTVRRKFHRIVGETAVGERVGVEALDVRPEQYVPYLAMRLEVEEETALVATVEDLLASVDWNGTTNPLSEVGSAFYVAMRRDDAYDVTQRDVADAAGVSTVTIRNNYRKYS